jgi:tRNA-dihydrouridine synthase
MLGRGAQGQPWLVGQIGAELRGEEPAAAPCGGDLMALVAEHYAAVLLEYGTSVGLRVARKHLDWYMQAAGIVLDKTSRNAFLNNENPAEVLGMIDTIFASERPVAA